jgi:hypothetical protein
LTFAPEPVAAVVEVEVEVEEDWEGADTTEVVGLNPFLGAAAGAETGAEPVPEPLLEGC